MHYELSRDGDPVNAGARRSLDAFLEIYRLSSRRKGAAFAGSHLGMQRVFTLKQGCLSRTFPDRIF